VFDGGITSLNKLGATGLSLASLSKPVAKLTSAKITKKSQHKFQKNFFGIFWLIF